MKQYYGNENYIQLFIEKIERERERERGAVWKYFWVICQTISDC